VNAAGWPPIWVVHPFSTYNTMAIIAMFSTRTCTKFQEEFLYQPQWMVFFFNYPS
jgi:hypothetical protein